MLFQSVKHEFKVFAVITETWALHQDILNVIQGLFVFIVRAISLPHSDYKGPGAKSGEAIEWTSRCFVKEST